MGNLFVCSGHLVLVLILNVIMISSAMNPFSSSTSFNLALKVVA